MIGSLISFASEYMWVYIFLWIGVISTVILLGYRHNSREMMNNSDSSYKNGSDDPWAQGCYEQINAQCGDRQTSSSDLILTIKKKLETTQFLNFTKFEDGPSGGVIEQPLSFLELVESTRLSKHTDDIFMTAAQAAASVFDKKIQDLQERVFKLEIARGHDCSTNCNYL